MSIEAMKLALEALESNHEEIVHYWALVKKNNQAITALRQAIEQAQKQEPVAWSCGCCNGSGWVVRDPDIGTDQECFVCEGTGKNIDTSPPQRQPLTEEQASDGFDQHSIRPTKLVSKYSFEAGVRYAEAAHGITGEQK